jgi:hypothetical protein
MGTLTEEPSNDKLRYGWSIVGRKIDADSLDKFDDMVMFSSEDGGLLLADLE